MNQKTLRQLLSGCDVCAAAKALRFLLRCVSVPYAWAVRTRNLLYDRGLLGTASASAPVISIGNITTGGTGKTPLVVWLCRYLENKGLRCAVLTRGYKTEQGSLSDEPALLAKACPGAVVVVDPDRIAGAQKATRQHGADVLVLDDGFQHRRLKRDLDILTLDATCPFGYERMLPAGLLREPLTGLRRAGVIVITRYDQAAAATIQTLEARLADAAPAIPVVKAVHRHTHAVTSGTQSIPLETLRGKRAFVFCGIGNPDAFIAHVSGHGIDIVGTRIFNDHHPYSTDDIKAIVNAARQNKAAMILCTQKDWVKTALLKPEGSEMTLAYLALELDFVEGLDILKARIDAVLENAEC